MKSLVLLFSLFFELSLWAAPHPATSTSFVLGTESGRYFSEHGFKVSLGSSGWEQTSAPTQFKNIEIIYRGVRAEPHLPPPSLTVRRDQLKKTTSLKSYIRKWMKDYHRFGFDILASQKVKVGSNTAYMLDLVHAETENQLRQVVFLRKRNAVILTCRDKKQAFLSSLKACNKIVRSFRWTL